MNADTRIALVTNGTPEVIANYLYANYEVVGSFTSEIPGLPARAQVTVIAGTDNAGFTLDAIIDRLATGLIWAREWTAKR